VVTPVHDGRALGIFDSNKRAVPVFDAKSQSFCTAPNRSFIGQPSFRAAPNCSFIGQPQNVSNGWCFAVPNNFEREYRHPTLPIFRKWFSG
jgi:hypothetical protein